MPPRAKTSHKGDYGRVLIVGGSRGMAGAAALAGMAALRSGAGLVTIACPQAVVDTVAGFEPSYMTLPLPSDSNGRAEAAGVDVILSHSFDVLGIGPGLSQSASLGALVTRLIEEVSRPLVIDADALNLLSSNTSALAKRPGPTILTPHPGEFSRLCGSPIEEIEADRIRAAVAFAGHHQVTLVLKGAGTIVTDGTRYAVNQTGNPGMAKGGSGDVLTGVVCAMIAQGLSAWESARLAVHIHGIAGDAAAREKSEVSLLARDIVEQLPAGFRHHNKTAHD